MVSLVGGRHRLFAWDNKTQMSGNSNETTNESEHTYKYTFHVQIQIRVQIPKFQNKIGEWVGGRHRLFAWDNKSQMSDKLKC